MAEVGAVYDAHPCPAHPDRHPPGHRRAPTPERHPRTGHPQQMARRQRRRRRRIRHHQHLRRSGPPRPRPSTAPGWRWSTATTTRSTRIHAEARPATSPFTIVIDIDPRRSNTSLRHEALRRIPRRAGRDWRNVSGSNGLSGLEREKEKIACQLTSARAQANGARRWGTRVIWRKLNCLKPNLQKVQVTHPPERRL